MHKIRIKLVIDVACTYEDKIDEVIRKIAEDYEVATDNELTVEFFKNYIPLNNLRWEDYSGRGDLGIEFAFINKDTRTISLYDLVKYDSVCYLIDEKNWKSTTTWGWNLGEFFNGYQVQLIRGDIREDFMYKTFKMEIFHMMDDVYFKRMGKSLDVFFKGDFDEDIVHIRNSAGTYTFYYDEAMKKMKDLLIAMFVRKEDYIHLTQPQKEALQISIIGKIIMLMRQYLALILKSSRPTAVFAEFKHQKHSH